jgi:hypothetical protein
MEGLVELHDNIMFYLVIILFGVGWVMISIVRNYTNAKSPISHKYLNHGTLIELIWTITPALILILIAFPSFKLLYLMDEVSDPAVSVLAEGHQWYWSYQYPDFLSADEDFIEFDLYLTPEPLYMDISRLLNPEITSSGSSNLGGNQSGLPNPPTDELTNRCTRQYQLMYEEGDRGFTRTYDSSKWPNDAILDTPDLRKQFVDRVMASNRKGDYIEQPYANGNYKEESRLCYRKFRTPTVSVNRDILRIISGVE